MQLSELEISKLQKLVESYIRAKSTILYAEEVDPHSKSNLQIIKELRDAFDHIMRVFKHKFDEIYKDKEKNTNKFIIENIEKTIGHVYRATFDALDGAEISLKELSYEALKDFPVDVILEVMPDYYELRRELYRIEKKVATHREKKDYNEDISNILNNYIEDVNKLHNIYQKILENGPLFAECLKKKKKREICKAIRKYIIGILIGLSIWGITSLIKNKISIENKEKNMNEVRQEQIDNNNTQKEK